MISDELLNKFNRIEDLPISEEMLGAYVEGNLDFYEEINISSEIQNSEYLSDMMQDINSIYNFDPFHTAPISDIEIPTDSLLMASNHDFAELSWDDNHEEIQSFLNCSLIGSDNNCDNEDLWDDCISDGFEAGENYSIGNDRNNILDDSLDLDSSDVDNYDDFDNLNY
jgi:hypothetical protein